MNDLYAFHGPCVPYGLCVHLPLKEKKEVDIVSQNSSERRL